MNTLALHRPRETQQYAQSWAVSLTIHGLAVGFSILLVSDLRLAAQPQPFKWDVSVVETPAAQRSEEATPTPPPPAPTPPTSASRPPARTEPVKTTPVESPAPVRTAQPTTTVQAIQREVRNEARETKSIMQSSPSALPQPTTQAIETVSRTAEPIETPQQVVQQTERVEQASVVEQAAPVQTEPAPVIEAQPLVKESPVVTSTQPETVTNQIVAAAAPMSSSDSTIVTQPLIEAAQATVENSVVTQSPAVLQDRAVAKDTETRTAEPTAIEQASVRELPVRSVPKTKADYSWLADVLWSRVEQLKHYPPIARMNRWEGKVVLRAVITDAGEVVGLEVTESSGHAILDRDALEVMKRASPLRLKHPLGQPQVVVHVPISYQLR